MPVVCISSPSSIFMIQSLVFSWCPSCLACSIHIFLVFFCYLLLFDLILILFTSVSDTLSSTCSILFTKFLNEIFI
jgi:hypothetical protein